MRMLGRSAAGGMCTAGGRVREGKPSLVRTGVNVIQDAGRGAADAIAARIPPGRVENPTNQDSNRPTDQQTNRATNQQSNNPIQQMSKIRRKWLQEVSRMSPKCTPNRKKFDEAPQMAPRWLPRPKGYDALVSKKSRIVTLWAVFESPLGPQNRRKIHFFRKTASQGSFFRAFFVACCFFSLSASMWVDFCRSRPSKSDDPNRD